MEIFCVTLGASRIEFSMWAMNGKYQGRINDLVIYESADYELVRAEILFDMGSNYVPYNQLLN